MPHNRFHSSRSFFKVFSPVSSLDSRSSASQRSSVIAVSFLCFLERYVFGRAIGALYHAPVRKQKKREETEALVGSMWGALNAQAEATCFAKLKQLHSMQETRIQQIIW